MMSLLKEKSELPYKNLLNEILKCDDKQDDYNPKNYSFNLDSLDKEGKEKK